MVSVLDNFDMVLDLVMLVFINFFLAVIISSGVYLMFSEKKKVGLALFFFGVWVALVFVMGGLNILDKFMPELW